MSDTPMPDTEGWGDEHWSEFIRANGNWIVPHLQLNFHRLPRKAQRKLRKIAEQIILSSDEDTEVTSNKKHKSTHITAPEMDVKPEQGTGEEPTSGDDGNALRRPRGTSSKGKVIHASEPAEEQVKGRTTRPGDETDGPKERATVTGSPSQAAQISSDVIVATSETKDTGTFSNQVTPGIESTKTTDAVPITLEGLRTYIQDNNLISLVNKFDQTARSLRVADFETGYMANLATRDRARMVKPEKSLSSVLDRLSKDLPRWGVKLIYERIQEVARDWQHSNLVAKNASEIIASTTSFNLSGGPVASSLSLGLAAVNPRVRSIAAGAACTEKSKAWSEMPEFSLRMEHSQYVRENASTDKERGKIYQKFVEYDKQHGAVDEKKRREHWKNFCGTGNKIAQFVDKFGIGFILCHPKELRPDSLYRWTNIEVTYMIDALSKGPEGFLYSALCKIATPFIHLFLDGSNPEEHNAAFDSIIAQARAQVINPLMLSSTDADFVAQAIETNIGDLLSKNLSISSLQIRPTASVYQCLRARCGLEPDTISLMMALYKDDRSDCKVRLLNAGTMRIIGHNMTAGPRALNDERMATMLAVGERWLEFDKSEMEHYILVIFEPHQFATDRIRILDSKNRQNCCKELADKCISKWRIQTGKEAMWEFEEVAHQQNDYDSALHVIENSAAYFKDRKDQIWPVDLDGMALRREYFHKIAKANWLASTQNK